MPASVRGWVVGENVTTNLHHDGVRPASFIENSGLAATFNVLSTNVDRKGRAFVSTIEGREAPLYGAQWHPERPQFEWHTTEQKTGRDLINHSPHAVRSMQ